MGNEAPDDKALESPTAEFDDAFEEFSDIKSGAAEAATDDDADEPSDDSAGDGADDTTKDDDTSDTAGAKAPGGEGDEKAKTEAEQAPATLTADELAKLDPKTRSAIEALQADNAALSQREKTHKGRISALSRLEHLSGKMSRLKTSGADSTAVGNEVKSYLESESFKKFKEINPELAEPFEALAATVSTIGGAVANDVQTLARETRRDLATSHSSYVLEQHPDYEAVVGLGKPEQAKKFLDWVANTQPDWVKDVVRDNGRGIVNGGNVVEVIDRYKLQHASDFKGTSGKEGGRSPADGENAGGQGVTNPDDVLRKRRQEAGASVQNRGAGAAGSTAPNEFDKAFDHFSKENDKKRSTSRR